MTGSVPRFRALREKWFPHIMNAGEYIAAQEKWDKEMQKKNRNHWESLDFKNWGELWNLETEAREKQHLAEWTNIIAKIVRKLNDGVK